MDRASIGNSLRQYWLHRFAPRLSMGVRRTCGHTQKVTSKRLRSKNPRTVHGSSFNLGLLVKGEMGGSRVLEETGPLLVSGDRATIPPVDSPDNLPKSFYC